jgi:excisionase family DNA binding protein
MDAKRLLTAKELAAMLSDPGWGTPPPPLMTIDEVAAALRVSKDTVYGWSSQGLLDDCKVKVGRKRLIIRDKFFHTLINEGLHDD